MAADPALDRPERLDGKDRSKCSGTYKFRRSNLSTRMIDRLLTFYGDDVTGSTDAMDALSRAGVETVLFLKPFDTETVDCEFPDAEAVGLAGTSRSMTPDEMVAELPRAFESLVEVGAPLVHYKICSTFDSAPEVGSIGKAIDIGADQFDTDTVPLLPGAPPLGRYVAFGNMFASDEETIHRLDRHPTMSQHPVTPMEESDLRRHLAKQTEKSMGLVNVLDLCESMETLRETYEEKVGGDEILFIDSVYRKHLQHAGDLLWNHALIDESSPTFVVGSSGVEYALTDHWGSVGRIEGERTFDPLESVPATLVMSGSASPVTETQIETALNAGFTGVRIRTEDLVNPFNSSERKRVTERVIKELRDGNSVVAYTARGPDDPAIKATKRACSELDDGPESAERFVGEQQGQIMCDVLRRVDVKRACVAGGDTCGAVAPYLDLYALQVRYPLAPGSPLCDVSAETARIDGMEIALKGGQLGHIEYFLDLERGTAD